MSNPISEYVEPPNSSYQNNNDMSDMNLDVKFNNVKTKKRVTFAPDTIIYEREKKPYKYHNLFRLAQMGIFINRDGKFETSTTFPNNNNLNNNNNKKQQSLMFDLNGNGNSDQFKHQLSKINEIVESNIFEHDYLKFTHARKTRDYMEKTNGPAATRAERLYVLMDELKIAHGFYNQLKTTTTRDHFLINELIIRHIMALDLALTESYLGVALEITYIMYDTTRFMLPLYTHIFYKEDGTKIDLSFNKLDGTLDEPEDYISIISPVISTLNKIIENRTRNDNRYFSPETLLTKLQLEMLVLTLCPIRSIMFRAILEIVPDTASAAYDAIYNCDSEPIRWANNSELRNDYEIILQNLGHADKIGCKGIPFTMISFAARSKQLKDISNGASLFELPKNSIKEE